MSLLRRSVVGWGVRLAVLGLVCLSVSGASMPASPHDNSGTLADKLYLREVRLRKLHLVRPDLIPYPIFYDIYC